jgi:hypothetical protein
MKLRETTLEDVIDGLQSYIKATNDEALDDLLQVALDHLKVTLGMLSLARTLIGDVDLDGEGEVQAAWQEGRNIFLTNLDKIALK